MSHTLASRELSAALDLLAVREALSNHVESTGEHAAEIGRLLAWANSMQQAAAEKDVAAAAAEVEQAAGDEAAIFAPAEPPSAADTLNNQCALGCKRRRLLDEHRPEPLFRAGIEEREEWAFRRRAGPFHKNQCGTGLAEGSLAALQESRTLTTICRSSGCGAFVDLKVATRHAKQAGTTEYQAGTGCANRPCTTNFKRANFARQQLKYRQLLQSGARILVEWPSSTDDEERLAYSPEAAIQVSQIE